MKVSSIRLTACVTAAFISGILPGRLLSRSGDAAAAEAARTAGAVAGTRAPDAHGGPSVKGAGAVASPVAPCQSASRLLSDAEWLAVQSAAPGVRQAALLQKGIDVLAAASDSDRLRQFSALMEFLQPGDFEVLLEAFKHHDRNGRSSFHDEFRMLALRAVTLGDTAPVKKLEGDFSRDQTIHLWFGPAVKAWALNHSKEAVNWWNHLPDGPLREGIAESVITGLAQGDPERGREYARLFPPGQQQAFAGRFFDNALMTGGKEAALAWIGSVDTLGLPDPEAVKRESAEKLRGSLWALNAREASEALTPLAAQPWAETALVRHVEKRGGEEPAQVAAWLEGLRETPHYEKLRTRLLGTWAAGDPDAAAAWASKTAPQR